MKNRTWKLVGVAAAAALFLGIGSLTMGTAHAEAVGCRSTTNAAQLTGFGRWDGTQGSIQICWDVAFNAGAWDYKYTLQSFSGTSPQVRGVSHLWLEVTEGATRDEFAISGDASIDEGPMATSGGGGASDPGFPGATYAMKIEPTGSDTNFMFTIRTARAPVWGDWYVKDGNNPETYAYNTGFTLADPASNALIAVEADHIVRPNGRDTAVPTPAAAGLMALGLAVAAWRRRNV